MSINLYDALKVQIANDSLEAILYEMSLDSSPSGFYKNCTFEEIDFSEEMQDFCFPF